MQDQSASGAAEAPLPDPRNLADLLRRHALASPEREALTGPAREGITERLDWAGLDALVDRVARGLADHGLVAGHRVALCGPAGVAWVAAYLAVLRAGLVAVPLDPSGDVAAACALTGARVVFAAGDPGAGVPQIPLTVDALTGLGTPGSPPDSPQDGEALAVLLGTAGPDSRPVMLSHRALLAAAQPVGAGVSADAVLALVPPLHHVHGLSVVLGGWLAAGARLVIPDGADRLPDVLAEERVTELPLGPADLERLLGDDRLAVAARHLRTVASGAAPLGEELRRRFTERTGLRVDQAYVLTEAAGEVAGTAGGPLLGQGHVGRPLPGVQLRIGDDSDPGEPGEVALRGPTLFSGYWPGGEGGPDADGWFATGDLGYLADGELFLVGRAAEVLTVRGFHVYPAELEQVIAGLAGVSGVAVLGVPGVVGDEVVAVVAGDGVTEEDVQRYCADRLARFKRPHRVVLVRELPRGATGKVQRSVLRAELAGGAR